MNSRDRVLTALGHETSDRIPRDLGGMNSTGISAFAYPKLVDALGLPPRKTRVHDTFQMLALPDVDVLEALEIDVLTINHGMCSQLEQDELWKPYNFGGRLDAEVRNPDAFSLQDDGTVVRGNSQMVPNSHVFDSASGGQALILEGELPRPDLKKMEDNLKKNLLTHETIDKESELCREVREKSDRALFYSGPINTSIGIGHHGGMGIFPLLCLEEPDYVEELHELVTHYAIENARRLLPAISENVDILMLAADDWGTQQAPIASPDIYEELFKPYLIRFNETVAKEAPNCKRFLHSCGAIYELIDQIIESGFEILNPVQWTAGGKPYSEWKDKCSDRIALWGGGVDSQGTLVHGSAEDVQRESKQISHHLNQGGGYVFCAIHNLLAEVPPEKIIALYEGAK